MPPYIPLRWESTGDQWWYASPIDLAAANGHYDLVRELIRLDPNNIIRLTSLRRIRRLESVWDDDAQSEAAACRSSVARNLFQDCERRRGRNSLIRAGYGGWLLYTAASAGDLGFVQELLQRDPLLVFGEGEYGVTDILYGAARGRSSEVFKLLYDHAVSPRCYLGNAGELEKQVDGVPPAFRWEMRNRAVHAAARGGSWEILRELLGECSDALAYRDVHGSTVLHAASGRGQVEVVNGLVSLFHIVTSRDNRGNTSLHIAAYRGHVPVVEALIHADPSSIFLTNNAGDTFLHMAVIGFRSPGFRRVDRQIELMNKLAHGNFVNLGKIINIRNHDGRTALHIALIGNIQSSLVQLLTSIRSIDLNIRDIDGRTALDLLSRRPQSASLGILIKQLISAGGISNTHDYMSRSAIVTHLRMQGIGCSPGTSFRIPDSEIFLHTGIENVSEISCDKGGSARPSSCSSTSRSTEVSHRDNTNAKAYHNLSGIKKTSPVNYAKRRLKLLLGWPRQKKKRVDQRSPVMVGTDSADSYQKLSDLGERPTSLRERFTKPSSLPNNKRTLSVRSTVPSPTAKKKLAAGLMHGVIQAMPHLASASRSPSCSFSRSPLSSPPPLLDKLKQKGIMSCGDIGEPSCFGPNVDEQTSPDTSHKTGNFSYKLMNQYFCFGAQGLSLDAAGRQQHSSQACKQSVLLVA